MKRSIGCMIAICILLSSITVSAQIGQFWADGDFKIICDLGIVPKEYREKDINDLITNTVGACLGFFIYQLLSKLASKELCRKFQSYNINEGTELLFFIIYSFVIMVTIQPIIISTLFHLA